MNRGDLHDNDHHVLRYIRHRLVIRDIDTQAVLGLYPEAFALREDEEYLSVNWCELFGSPNSQAVVTACINSVKQHLKVTNNSLFALGNIGQILTTHKAQTGKTNLKVRFWPDPKKPNHNPSHSGLFNLDQNEETLAKLANEAFKNLYDSSCNPIP